MRSESQKRSERKTCAGSADERPRAHMRRRCSSNRANQHGVCRRRREKRRRAASFWP